MVYPVRGVKFFDSYKGCYTCKGMVTPTTGKIGKCNRCNSIDKCYDQVTAKLELGNDTEFKVFSSFSPIIEEISGSNDATIETLLFSEPFHAEYSTTGIITKISR